MVLHAHTDIGGMPITLLHYLFQNTNNFHFMRSYFPQLYVASLIWLLVHSGHEKQTSCMKADIMHENPTNNYFHTCKLKTWFDFTTTALEPAVLVSHPNGSFEYGGRRISMTCAAFGSPAPDIVWRSPTLGIPSIQPLANANRSISIFTEEITNAHRDALVLSTLELCDHDPSIKNVEISCTTSNGITTDLLGNQSASFFLDPYGKVPIMPPSCCLEGGIGRCLVWKPPNASQSLFERCYYKAGSTVLLNRPPPAVFIAYNTKTWEKSA